MNVFALYQQSTGQTVGLLPISAKSKPFLKPWTQRCVGKYVYDITDWCRCGGMLSDSAGHPVSASFVEVGQVLVSMGMLSGYTGNLRASQLRSAHSFSGVLISPIE
eukprot:1148432-Pelagomonas_calceolata.AAC.4